MENPTRRNRTANTENERAKGDDLPSDAITQILLSLPIKSVSRFRIVNKVWESISRCQSFVYAHLERATKCGTPSLLIFDKDSCITLIESNSWEMTSKVVNAHDGKLTLHISCCNGLVCLSDTEGRPMILNPGTKEFFMIPAPPNRSKFFEIGFDSLSKEYKVLRMCDHEEGKFSWEVFTVGGTSWRQVGTTSGGNFLIGGIYVNGVIYWVVHNSEERNLLSFDFKVEMFSSANKTTCEPLGIGIDGADQLFELDGSLGVAITREDIYVISPDNEEYQFIEIWLMSGTTDNWFKKYTIWVPREEDFHVLFLKEKMILLHNLSDNGLYYYDVESHSYGPKLFDLPELESCSAHVGSLVTLKGC